MEIDQELLEKEIEPTKTIGFWELFKATFPLGFITFGGPVAHIAVLEREFVTKRKWISNEEFTELIALGQSLPGPTSTQMVIAMGTLATKSPLGGLLAFSNFCIPSLAVLIVAAFFLSDQKTILDFPVWAKVFLEGISFAAISLVAQAAYKLTQKVAKTKLTQTTLILGAIAHFLFPAAVFMVAIMAFGGLISLLFKESEANQDLSKQVPLPENKLSNKRNIILLGGVSLFIYVFLLFSFLGLYLGFPETIQLRFFFHFFKIGSLIFGGGHVVLPMIMTEFSDKVSETQFLNGFAIVSALPGPMFNFSAYIGYILGGYTGAALCTIAMFLPAFFSIWGFLPLWSFYRDKPVVKRMLRGICATAVGFIYVALIKLLIAGGEFTIMVASAIAMLTFCLLDIWDWPAPVVLVIGGLLRLGLWASSLSR